MHSLVHGQPTRANINILNNKSGLAGLEAKWFHIDDQSHIWIETTTGLDEWNGYRFAHHNPPNLPVTHDPYRPPIFEDAAEDDKYIYFFYYDNSTSFDVYNKRSSKFEERTFKDVIGGNKAMVRSDAHGEPFVLVQTPQGSEIHNLFTKKIYAIPSSEHLDKIVEFAPATDGFWFRDSLFHIQFLSKDGTTTLYSPPEKRERRNEIEQVNHVFDVTPDGDLWYSIPHHAGLYKQMRESKAPVLIPNLTDGANVVHLWQDKNGRTLIALSQRRQVMDAYLISEDGVNFKEWDFLLNRSKLGTKIESDDFYQRIHFGTFQKLEIINFEAPFIGSVLQKETIPGQQYGRIVIGINEMANGNLLITSEDETYALNRATGESWPSTEPHEAYIERLPTMAWDKSTLVSTLNTTSRFADQISIQHMDGRPATFISIDMHGADIIQLDDDHMLLIGQDASITHGLLINFRTNEIQWLPSTEYPLLTTSTISHGFHDIDNGKIYFSSNNNGLLEANLKGNTISKLKRVKAEDLPQRDVISINKRSNGDLLVGSFYGLHIYDPRDEKVVNSYSRDEGLTSNIVASAIEDKYGAIWIATYSGLNTLYPDGRIGRFYDTDGLPYDEFNRNVVLSTGDGKLYFGSGNGLVIIDPDRFQSYESTFSVLYSSARYRTDDREILIDSLPTTASKFAMNELRAIDIFVGNNDWGFTDDVTYYYRTAGLDSTWQRTSDQRISVERLPRGNYSIEIKAQSRYGIWSTNSINFPVHIYVPFFSRNWVRIAGIVLLLSLLGYYLSHADRRRFKQRADFQRRVSALELSLLQSQMNPHFIFNALGAIQFYIYNNQGEIAEDYLSKFANLMRMFLESSRLKLITLADEIKLIKSYIELEQMRFPDKFDSTITTDVDESLEHYQLPAMMLQPFIENAINHGIFHKKGHGELTLSFTNDEQYLICVIDDNGIGRKAAQAIRKASLKPHKSRSTQITEERLEILKEAEEMDITIKYYDYDEAHDGRSGTKVSIFVPLMA